MIDRQRIKCDNSEFNYEQISKNITTKLEKLLEQMHNTTSSSSGKFAGWLPGVLPDTATVNSQ